jgi:hypothetical protein
LLNLLSDCKNQQLGWTKQLATSASFVFPLWDLALPLFKRLYATSLSNMLKLAWADDGRHQVICPLVWLLPCGVYKFNLALG